MRWDELRKQIEAELDSIENKIESNDYDYDELKEQLKDYYSRLLKINNFVKYSNNRIKKMAQKMKSRGSSGLGSFVQSMRIAPVDLTTFIDKGWNFMVEEQYDDAIEVLEKAHELAPNDIKTMNLLGWAYIHKKHYDDAMMIFQKVLNKDNDNALAKNNLGFVCFKKGIYGEAIEHLSSVLNTSNEQMSLIYANFYLGLIYLEREMYDDALKFFQKTKEIAPNHMEAYYYEAITYLNMGFRHKAHVLFSELIKKNKYNKWAQRAEEKIKELNGEDYEEEDKS